MQFGAMSSGGQAIAGSSSSCLGQLVESASNSQQVSSAAYFDIANSILGSTVGDLNDILLNSAKNGDYNRIEQLFSQGSDDHIIKIDCKDKHTGNTALIWAAKKGNNKIVQLLLRHGADPTLRNYEAQTALEVATGTTKTFLLDSVTRTSERTHRLLLQAAWQGNVEVVHRLLSNNKVLDISYQNAESLTPLMLVARDVQMFERLTSQLKRSYNPVEVAEELLKAHANVHTLDNDGRTCLHYAAQSMANSAEKLVHTLVSGGADQAQLDKHQYTPIHWASHFGNTNVVVTLLDGGSEVNSSGYAGLTPLHISAQNDHPKTATILLQHGADITITDDRGKTPMDMAKTRRMKTLLKEAWTEATQKNKPPELGPLKTSNKEDSRMDITSAGLKKREVIFDGVHNKASALLKTGQPARATSNLHAVLSNSEKALQAEIQMMQDIANGKFVVPIVLRRENTRLLGAVRNRKSPVLPVISRNGPSPISVGHQSPELHSSAHQNSASEELRRSLEDDRAMSGQHLSAKRGTYTVKGVVKRQIPLLVSHTDLICAAADTNNSNSQQLRQRASSDPFISPSMTDIVNCTESIIQRRGEVRHLYSNCILPPTSSTSSQQLSALAEHSLVIKDNALICKEEPSAASSDGEVAMVNKPEELSRSHSLLKEEFILAESRPRDLVLTSSSGDLTSGSSSASTSSSSPRDGTSFEPRSNSSLLMVTLKERTAPAKASDSLGKQSDPSAIRLTASSRTVLQRNLTGGNVRTTETLKHNMKEISSCQQTKLDINTEHERNCNFTTSSSVAGSSKDACRENLKNCLFKTLSQPPSRTSPNTTISCSNMKRSQSFGSVQVQIQADTTKQSITIGSSSKTQQTKKVLLNPTITSNSIKKNFNVDEVLRKMSTKSKAMESGQRTDGKAELCSRKNNMVVVNHLGPHFDDISAEKGDKRLNSTPQYTKSKMPKCKYIKGSAEVSVEDSHRCSEEDSKGSETCISVSNISAANLEETTTNSETVLNCVLEEAQNILSSSSANLQNPNHDSELDSHIFSAGIKDSTDEASRNKANTENLTSFMADIPTVNVQSSTFTSIKDFKVLPGDSKPVFTSSPVFIPNNLDANVASQTTPTMKMPQKCTSSGNQQSVIKKKPASGSGENQGKVHLPITRLRVESSPSHHSSYKAVDKVIAAVKPSISDRMVSNAKNISQTRVNDSKNIQPSSSIVSTTSVISADKITVVTKSLLNPPKISSSPEFSAVKQPGTSSTTPISTAGPSINPTCMNTTDLNSAITSQDAKDLPLLIKADATTTCVSISSPSLHSKPSNTTTQSSASDQFRTSSDKLPSTNPETSNNSLSTAVTGIIKSPSDSILNTKNAHEKSTSSISPLVKITFGCSTPNVQLPVSRHNEYAAAIHTPIIVNAFEYLLQDQAAKETTKESSLIAEKSRSAVKGRCTAMKTKDNKEKRPVSGPGRQHSATKRKGNRAKEYKVSGTEDLRPKSGRTRARSGKKQTKKQVEKHLDEKAAKLSEAAGKNDVALISGIGWHVVTSCRDKSDIQLASEFNYDSSDFEVSDVESIEDAESHLQLDRFGPPNFADLKSKNEGCDSPLSTHDVFPYTNFDKTVSDAAKLQFYVDPSVPENSGFAVEDEQKLIHESCRLTPIPETPTFGTVQTTPCFNGSMPGGQQSQQLDGTVMGMVNSASKFLHQTEKDQSFTSGLQIVENSAEKQLMMEPKHSHGGIQKTKPQDGNLLKVTSHDKALKRTQSLKESNTSENKETKRERKFSESKKEEEDIEDVIEEILNATGSSVPSSLRSVSSLMSTFEEGGSCRLLNKEESLSPRKLKSEHVGRVNQTQCPNPNILRVLQTENPCLRSKSKTKPETDKVNNVKGADEETKQLLKVMNSFRNMELYAGSGASSTSSHVSREPLVRSESKHITRIVGSVESMPVVRPSSAGASRNKGRFRELKVVLGTGMQHSTSIEKLKVGTSGSSMSESDQSNGRLPDNVNGSNEEILLQVLVKTMDSETVCSHLNVHHGSTSGSIYNDDSCEVPEEETIKWKKGNILGKGAFGTVWCGLTNEGELIAVKQIELTTTDRQKAEHEYEKVQEEVELLKTLNHINIVSYLGTSFEENVMSIFMQFIPGGSIANILARFGALDEAVFQHYTRQILQGVEYLHANDVIHRDIKGANVMLMPNGTIKLIDFGCAKRVCINLSLSETQILRSMKGTPYWMAPEVVNESGHGKKSDIWSIGCTVFEMATRKPPWAEMNPMAAIFAIGSGERPVPKLPERFSPEAITFVSRCLTRMQQDRPTASQLLDDPFVLRRMVKK